METAEASREVYPEGFKRNFFVGKEDIYNEPRWWYVGLMTNSDIAFSLLRLLRSAGIFDHSEKIRYDLTVKAKAANMRNNLSMCLPKNETHPQPNVLKWGLQSEIICAFIYGMGVALCCFVVEGLIHALVNQIFSNDSSSVIIVSSKCLRCVPAEECLSIMRNACSSCPFTSA